MTPEKIHENLEKMLENPKSRNFLNHLVRAYIPETNITSVTSTPKDKANFKCVLTRVPLLSNDDITQLTNSSEYQDKIKNSSASNLEEKNAEALAFVTNGKPRAVTGKDTTTFMSTESHKIFVDWVVTKSLKADKHINWLLGSIKRSSIVKRAESIGDVEVQNKIEKIKNKGRGATFTLGDSNDALAKLKSKLESEGN